MLARANEASARSLASSSPGRFQFGPARGRASESQVHTYPPAGRYARAGRRAQFVTWRLLASTLLRPPRRTPRPARPLAGAALEGQRSLCFPSGQREQLGPANSCSPGAGRKFKTLAGAPPAASKSNYTERRRRRRRSLGPGRRTKREKCGKRAANMQTNELRSVAGRARNLGPAAFGAPARDGQRNRLAAFESRASNLRPAENHARASATKSSRPSERADGARRPIMPIEPQSGGQKFGPNPISLICLLFRARPPSGRADGQAKGGRPNGRTASGTATLAPLWDQGQKLKTCSRWATNGASKGKCPFVRSFARPFVRLFVCVVPIKSEAHVRRRANLRPLRAGDFSHLRARSSAPANKRGKIRPSKYFISDASTRPANN